MDANKQGKDSVLSDKQKFGSGHGHAQPEQSAEKHAKDELAHMGEKTKQQPGASQGGKK